MKHKTNAYTAEKVSAKSQTPNASKTICMFKTAQFTTKKVSVQLVVRDTNYNMVIVN